MVTSRLSVDYRHRSRSGKCFWQQPTTQIVHPPAGGSHCTSSHILRGSPGSLYCPPLTRSQYSMLLALKMRRRLLFWHMAKTEARTRRLFHSVCSRESLESPSLSGWTRACSPILKAATSIFLIGSSHIHCKCWHYASGIYGTASYLPYTHGDCWAQGLGPSWSQHDSTFFCR